jgi:FlaG/FlaF family flagellin (archaellin)
MRVGKRGLSPVVASVLIILLVMALFSIIFSWARGFVADQTEATSDPNTKLCPAVEFIIMNTSVVGTNTALEIVNRGDVDIDSFNFKISYNDGNSETINLNIGALAKGSSTGSIDFGNSGFEEIEVFAVLGSGPKAVACSENSVYFGF